MDHQRGLNIGRPTLVFFLAPTKLSNHMDTLDRQARTGDIALVKSREMTGIRPKHCRGGWGEKGGKDGRK
jgi:hypothetical protein